MLSLRQIFIIHGLDLDKGNQRIFWVDAALDRVESIDYNGGNRKLIFQLSGLHPFGVALAPPFLFFTDWNTKREVHKLDALTGEVLRSYSINGGQPMGVVIYDGFRQPSGTKSICAYQTFALGNLTLIHILRKTPFVPILYVTL